MSTLADAILREDFHSVRQFLRYGENVNQMDEYGFRPLIEAAIVDNVEMSRFLLKEGADPNLQDATGGTALHWAAENNNLELATLLLEHHANPNIYTVAGQSALVMPMLRHHLAIKRLLIQSGASEIFAQDYINTKMLGHLFELVGHASIVSPTNQFVDVDFEGFFLEVTLGLISDSLAQFQNHFAARQLRRYSGLAQFIVDVLKRASQLIQYQQYRVDTHAHRSTIASLLKHDPLIIPVGYEGHAITFIRYGTIWTKCDRREDSRLYDNVMFYRIGHPEALTADFLASLIYTKQTSEFINEELDRQLGLTPITELKVASQISGNCSWANVEATIPALFFLVLMQMNQDMQAMAYHKTLALNFFQRWREWNKDRALDFCIQAYQEGDPIRKATKAEILATILFQCIEIDQATNWHRIEAILKVLFHSPYEYILKNYLRIYYHEGRTEAGKRFDTLLKEYGHNL